MAATSGHDDAFSDPEECDERVACRVAAYCDSLVGMVKSARSKIMSSRTQLTDVMEALTARYCRAGEQR